MRNKEASQEVPLQNLATEDYDVTEIQRSLEEKREKTKGQKVPFDRPTLEAALLRAAGIGSQPDQLTPEKVQAVQQQLDGIFGVNHASVYKEKVKGEGNGKPKKERQ